MYHLQHVCTSTVLLHAHTYSIPLLFLQYSNVVCSTFPKAFQMITKLALNAVYVDFFDRVT